MAENVTDNIIRAERVATSLKTAGNVVSDGFLVAMVLKDLPDGFRAFSTVVTQNTADLQFFDFESKR